MEESYHLQGIYSATLPKARFATSAEYAIVRHIVQANFDPNLFIRLGIEYGIKSRHHMSGALCNKTQGAKIFRCKPCSVGCSPFSYRYLHTERNARRYVYFSTIGGIWSTTLVRSIEYIMSVPYFCTKISLFRSRSGSGKRYRRIQIGALFFFLMLFAKHHMIACPWR